MRPHGQAEVGLGRPFGDRITPPGAVVGVGLAEVGRYRVVDECLYASFFKPHLEGIAAFRIYDKEMPG
jgi:hypothetical protein